MVDIKSYAGIGSRNISKEETETITQIANRLSEDYVLYSGNADGADIAFQTGSDGACVVFLPWKDFNLNHYNHQDAIMIVPEITYENDNSVDEFHPCPEALGIKSRAFMRRNYHQVMGYDPLNLPIVDFVICCADYSGNNDVKGGTGQAVRIAKSKNIPIINIRKKQWQKELERILNG